MSIYSTILTRTLKGRPLTPPLCIKGRVKGKGRVRGHREVKGDDTGRVTMGDKDGIKGRVRGGKSVQTSVWRRRVYEESIAVTKLLGRRDLSGRRCMENQEKRKEDYMGKTMGRLDMLNWRE
jgi:hypothetical protein